MRALFKELWQRINIFDCVCDKCGLTIKRGEYQNLDGLCLQCYYDKAKEQYEKLKEKYEEAKRSKEEITIDEETQPPYNPEFFK